MWKQYVHMNLSHGRGSENVELPRRPSLGGYQQCSNGYTPKGFKLGYDIVILVLKRFCQQMENRWEMGQEWMSSEQLLLTYRILIESGDSVGLLDRGDIGGNTKK